MLDLFKSRSVIALLPVAIAIVLFPRLSELLSSGDLLLTFAACLSLYILTMLLAENIHSRLWDGYAEMTVVVTWLIIELEAALVVVIVGSFIAEVLRAYVLRRSPPASLPALALEQITIAGIGILVADGVLSLFDHHPPFINHQPAETVTVLLALVVASLTVRLLGHVITRKYSIPSRSVLRRQLLMTVLFIAAAMTLPVVFYQVGSVAFLVVLMLCGVQIYQHYQQHNKNGGNLIRRVQELSVLNRLSVSIGSHLKLEDVLQTIYAEVSGLVNATTFCIALYDSENQIIEYPLVIQNGKRIYQPSHAPGDGLTDTIIHNHKPLYLTRHNLDESGIAPEQFSDAAYLGVPLMQGNHIIGVIALSHADDPDAFSDEDVTIFQAVAGQVSLAIRNARLYDRTARLAHNLSLINQSIQDVMFNLDRMEALRIACELAINITEADKSGIFLLEDDSSARLQLVRSMGFEGDNAPNLNAPHRPEIYSSGARYITDVTQTDDEIIREHAAIGHFKATLEIPLYSGNAVTGYLAVYHDDPHYYDPAEISLLVMLANQIIAALDNAELLRALEVYASEQTQLVHLSRISSSTLDIKRIVIDVCQTLRQMLMMDRIEIGLFEPDKDWLSMYHPPGNGQVDVRQIDNNSIPEFNTLRTADIMKLTVYYAGSGKHSPQLEDFIQQYGLQTLTTIPMFINRRVIGFIAQGKTTHYRFSSNDRRLIEMATHQIAAQLQNARIHTLTEQALVQRLEQLALIEEIAGQISQSLDPDRIIENVLHAALRATGADIAQLALPADRDTFRSITLARINGKDRTYRYTLPGQSGVIGQIARSGQPIIADHTRHVPDYVPFRQQAPGQYPTCQSLLAVPLLQGDRVTGVLNLESIYPAFFTPEQVGFIKSLAVHATISLDNARLLEERQYQINTLTYLRQLTLESAAILNRDDITIVILKTVLHLLPGRDAALFSYDIMNHELEMIGGMTREGDSFKPARPDIPAATLYTAIQKQTLYVIEDMQTYDRYGDDTPLSYRGLMNIPIRRRGEIHEILSVTFRQPFEPGSRDRRTIDLLAVQVAGHLENITLNETIRMNNNRMRAIQNATRDGLLLMDRTGKIQDANAALSEFLGVDLRSFVNHRLEHVILDHFGRDGTNHADGSGAELLHMAQQYWQDPEQVTQREYALRHENQTHYVRELGVPVRDDGERFMGRLYSLRDITDEMELADYRQKIQSMVLHDLQSPLGSIVSSLDLAADLIRTIIDDDLTAEQITSILEISLDSARQLMALVETLRDIPRMQKGEFKLDQNVTAISDLVQSAYQTLAASMQEAGIKFETRLDDSSGYVHVDQHLIRRVFINLMHNAFKFTPPDGTILVASVDSDDSGFIRFMVCDTGPGIPETMQQRIFNEFEQIKDQKPIQGGKGSGLGLNFCKLAVEAHGGNIRVETEGLLPGACFAFTLPIAERDRIQDTINT